MGWFRIEFVGGTTQDVEADDFDDDGTTITMVRYTPPGGDPIDPETTKQPVATFPRAELMGPPLPASS